MQKIRRWLYVALLAGCCVLLYGQFLHAERWLEPALMTSGRATLWWSVVLGYWLLDSTLVIMLAYFVRIPFGLRMPANFPFFQYAIDLAVLMFLVHLSWLATDHYVSPALAAIGLGRLWQLLVVLGTIWLALAFLRFKHLRRLVASDTSGQRTV